MGKTEKDFKNLRFSREQVIWIKTTAGEIPLKSNDVFFHGFPFDNSGIMGNLFKTEHYWVNQKERLLLDVRTDEDVEAEIERRVEERLLTRLAEELAMRDKVDISNYIPYSWSGD